MKQILIRIKCASVIAILIMISVISPVFASAQRDVSPVRLFSDGSMVLDSSSSLVRTDSGAAMTLQTSGLNPGNAITVWWVIFNYPEFCSSGMFGLRCGEADLFNPDVVGSVMHASGHVIGGSGIGNFGGSIKVGTPTKFVAFGPGLINPLGADIHLVVLDHGQVDPSLMPDQIHTVNVCNPVCTDVQFAAHEII